MPVYKNEEKGTWFCAFYYTDWMGNHKKKKKEGFRTLREAKAYERYFLEKAAARPNMSFSTLVAIYMEDCKTRLKPTTYAGKVFLIDTKIIPFFKNMPIDTIEPSTIRRWQNALMEDKNNYSPTYLKTIHNQITAILNFAVKYYKLPSNPARICGSIGRKNASAMQFWTLQEFNRFLPHLAHKPMSKMMFELLFWTGVRSGELLALTANDFDFQAKTLSINKNYARHAGTDLIMLPKTPRSTRVISLPVFICESVQAYINSLYDYQPDQRLFPVTKSFLQHEMIRASSKAGLKRIRVHDLRHSHASMLIEEGFSALLISERLGHENIETTLQTYSHLYPNKQIEVANRLDQMRQSPRKKRSKDLER